jgi:Icc protein
MVKTISFGHIHQEIKQTHQHMTFLGSPSTCYQFKPQQQSMSLDNQDPAYRVVTLKNDGKIETCVYRVLQIPQ